MLKAQFARGECDIILTTEVGVDPEGETIAELPLVWVGAPQGTAWKQRPLRLAYEHNCIFRGRAQAALQTSMWMYPAEAGAPRADVMQQHAVEPAAFDNPPAAQMQEKGRAWVQRWTKTVLK